MRHIKRLLVPALFALLLVGCGAESRPQALVGQTQAQVLVGRAEPKTGLVGRAELQTH